MWGLIYMVKWQKYIFDIIAFPNYRRTTIWTIARIKKITIFIPYLRATTMGLRGKQSQGHSPLQMSTHDLSNTMFMCHMHFPSYSESILRNEFNLLCKNCQNIDSVVASFLRMK